MIWLNEYESLKLGTVYPLVSRMNISIMVMLTLKAAINISCHAFKDATASELKRP